MTLAERYISEMKIGTRPVVIVTLPNGKPFEIGFRDAMPPSWIKHISQHFDECTETIYLIDGSGFLLDEHGPAEHQSWKYLAVGCNCDCVAPTCQCWREPERKREC